MYYKQGRNSPERVKKMAAIKGKKRPDMEGNQLWKIAAANGTIGRNRIFNDPTELKEKIDQYFRDTDQRFWEKEDFIKSGELAGTIIRLKTKIPYTIEGMSEFLGVNSKYIYDFENQIKEMKDRKIANDFSDVLTYAREKISRQKLEGAMCGAFNPLIVARLEGLRDRQDITSNNKDLNLTVEFKNKDEIKKISESLERDV